MFIFEDKVELTIENEDLFYKNHNKKPSRFRKKIRVDKA